MSILEMRKCEKVDHPHMHTIHVDEHPYTHTYREHPKQTSFGFYFYFIFRLFCFLGTKYIVCMFFLFWGKNYSKQKTESEKALVFHD